MKPRTTTSDVTALPEQSQLEVCNIENEIGILHRQSVRQWNVFFSHKMSNATNVGIPMQFQASSLHAFIVVGLRDPDTANQQNFVPAAEQRFPRGLLQPERGM